MMEPNDFQKALSDEACFLRYTANRRAVITAGKCARAEQARLEQQLRLQDGRTPRPD
jgi:hypothetical protein